MVLHTVPYLPASVRTLFSKLRDGGSRLLPVTFGDDSRGALGSCLERMGGGQTDRSIRGTSVLPSGNRVRAESYFHGEGSHEKEIPRHGTFSKRRLGPLFAAYGCQK